MSTDMPAIYQDPDQPIDDRVADLIARMTLQEKVSQLSYRSCAIERLGIPEYNWWNEALHGVARAGAATVFPQAIGMAASFDTALLEKVASAISDEGRAKFHAGQAIDNRGQYMGLTFWSPNINIFRDPRWGRGHETYGECPYLSGQMGKAFVAGLQGDDKKHLKAAACAKHYAVHSGPEADRHHFDALVDRRDLSETYLPAFKALVTEANVEAVMGAYNRVNGEPACASKTLLEYVLRGQWDFRGHVVSDCWAINDIHAHHKVTHSPAESAAMALKAGCDLNCGCTYPHLLAAHQAGLVDEETIDIALGRLMRTRMKLGLFDPPEKVKWADTDPRVVCSKKHRKLARDMARESIVLLKNDNDTLPLARDLKHILVVGPWEIVTAQRVLEGNYNGTAQRYVTMLAGIAGQVSAGTRITYDPGCGLTDKTRSGLEWVLGNTDRPDVIIAFMGLTPALEGEEGETEGSGDRDDINLPGVQEETLRKLHASGVPTVLVTTGGSALALGWAKENLPAICHAWYPGEQGGRAVADVLFGEFNPAGRLPVTFYASTDQLPSFDDYRMAGRTYRFFEGEPLWRFGYGLSYTRFEYDKLSFSAETLRKGAPVRVQVKVANVGDVKGDEVVQVYLRHMEPSVRAPRWQLVGFDRKTIKPGKDKRVSFSLRPEQFQLYDDEGRGFVEPGLFEIAVGNCQPDDPAFVGLRGQVEIKS
jgi:beta-glucosidase